MALADLFANNALVRLVTGDKARYALAVSLIGVQTGERVLLVGSGDGVLLAALAVKAGLSGQVCGVDEHPGSAMRAQAVATKAGVLVDVHEQEYHDRWPFDDGAFDVVAVRPEGSLADEIRLASALGEAYRTLRPGGRVTVVIDQARSGLAGIVAPREAVPARTEADIARLTDAGFKGARLLAARDGWAFVEGARPGHQ